jgi:hypothetical protein
MQNLGVNPSRYGLEMHGIKNARVALWNLGTAPLIEYCLSQQEGVLASGGALVVRTGSIPVVPHRTNSWFATPTSPTKSGGVR